MNDFHKQKRFFVIGKLYFYNKKNWLFDKGEYCELIIVSFARYLLKS